MSNLKIVNGRMTTLALAELMGAKHDDVLEKAKKLLDDLEIGHLSFQELYLSRKNEQLTMFSLDKDLSIILAGQYEPKIAYHVAQAFNKQPVQGVLNPSESSMPRAYSSGLQAYNLVKACANLT